MIKAQCIGFLNTPPLWDARQFDVLQFDFPTVNMDSFQAKPIPGNIRLGHQIEYVFKQLVEASGSYQVLVYNLPIRQGEKTLGEVDFILHNTLQNKLIHVELTYKFYIIDPSVSEPIHRLIGPNRRDAFFDKMEKIKHKQFPLLHSIEGAKALKDKGIDHLHIEHQCCFKAQLFQPFRSKTVDIGPLNHACLAGYWLRLADLNASDFSNAQYYMPTKSEWVIEPNKNAAWKSHHDIKIDIKTWLDINRAPLIWMKKTDGFEKFFVVWW